MKNQLTAKYYKAENDQQIVIYNEQGKLVEFPVADRSLWGLPPLDTWKQTKFGCEIKFRYEVVK